MMWKSLIIRLCR